MTMGISQMLTCMTERLFEHDAEADVKVFRQELNPETFAIVKADMLIRGGNSDNMSCTANAGVYQCMDEDRVLMDI